MWVERSICSHTRCEEQWKAEAQLYPGAGLAQRTWCEGEVEGGSLEEGRKESLGIWRQGQRTAGQLSPFLLTRQAEDLQISQVVFLLLLGGGKLTPKSPGRDTLQPLPLYFSIMCYHLC